MMANSPDALPDEPDEPDSDKSVILFKPMVIVTGFGTSLVLVLIGLTGTLLPSGAIAVLATSSVGLLCSRL